MGPSTPLGGGRCDPSPGWGSINEAHSLPADAEFFKPVFPASTIKPSGVTSVDSFKLVAIVRLRDEMIRWLAGGTFLPPTTVDNQATVGFWVGTRTWLAEGQDFLAAYHKLHEGVGRTTGEIACRERLGGILRYYHGKAA